MFRQKYGASIDSQNLGAALNWVTGHAGPEGVLGDLLRAPLEETKASFGGMDVMGRVWGEITEIWPKLEGTLFFQGQDGATLPPEAALSTLLNGESGLVVQARQAAATGATLSPEAKQWLDTATRLSELLYKKGSAEMRPIVLTVAVDSAPVDPEKLAADASLAEFKLYLGSGAEFAWKEGGPSTSPPLGIYLVGEKAFKRSYLQTLIKFKKSKFMGMGKVIVDIPGTLEEASVAAPLKLLAKGREGGLDGLESGEILQFVFPIEDGGKKKGSLALKLRVEGEDLGRLLSFLRTGLPRPPAGAK